MDHIAQNIVFYLFICVAVTLQ